MRVCLAYELHLHSCLSPCGSARMTPSNIAGMAMLNGVRIAALTDHNTTGNCPAFFAACRKYGIVPVAGMELTTAEEIHLVCLFPSLDCAMEFDGFLAAHRPPIRNRPDIFGDQWILNADDEIIGTESNLLVLATDLDLSSAVGCVRQAGGIVFPAHIDRQANGLVGILGDFPSTPLFRISEFRDLSHYGDYLLKHPALQTMTVLQNSDAHDLEQMNTDPPTVELLLPDGFEEMADAEELIRQALFFRLCGKQK